MLYGTIRPCGLYESTVLLLFPLSYKDQLFPLVTLFKLLLILVTYIYLSQRIFLQLICWLPSVIYNNNL